MTTTTTSANAGITDDDTTNPDLTSWVDSANAPDCDFPVQNLPFGRFRRHGDSTYRIGVAIGDRVLDLRMAGLVHTDDMTAIMAMDGPARRNLRLAISQGLRAGSSARALFEDALHPLADVELGLPCHIGDYTDFYSGIHHATTVGKLFRPDSPLPPNYKWVPIGYHGRVSSIGISGQSFPRPSGQIKTADSDAPVLAPSQRMDYELELGIVLGRGNESGAPIPIDDAENAVFGLTLLNDWSARDLQAWETQPLGPFLSKNFATTISPWIVPMEALAPFRAPFSRPEGDPAPLAYLDSAANRDAGALDIVLEVWLESAAMREAGSAPHMLSSSNYTDAYWTIAQLVAHHTVNGCNLQGGDLLGTGTLSGASPEQAGSLLELSMGGKQAIQLGNGEKRSFLEDGDRIILRAWCQREGRRRIGFGECSGTLLPARERG
jgi:fumarylacetoacetase